MIALEISNVSKTYGTSIQTLHTVSIHVQKHELVSIIGPSGCGKSTLLDCIAGLVQYDSGDITIQGKKGLRGNVGYMMQDDCLLPWRSVLDNVILPLEIAGIKKHQARKEAASLLEQFGLEQFTSHYPATLSGGMRKRASLLRTYLCKKDIMLLDEPFGNLDALTRLKMQEWFLEIRQKHKKTVLFVTHDIDEAIFLSDRIYVFSKRPGTVIGEIHLPFKRPRSMNAITSIDWIKTKKKLLQLL